MFSFKFRLFPLGFFTGMFDPEKLQEAIREGCQDGHRLIRREFSFEIRRVALVLIASAFGMVFRKDEKNPEPECDYKIKTYQTRFFTRTINLPKMEQAVNEGAQDGYEMFFALKYPTRFLFIFPREAYMFIFRKPYKSTGIAYQYTVTQTPYRFFTQTLDQARYEKDLNQHGQDGQLKKTFRDEKRVLGIFRQLTAVAIFERQIKS